jgi:hypothetical protein
MLPALSGMGRPAIVPGKGTIGLHIGVFGRNACLLWTFAHLKSGAAARKRVVVRPPDLSVQQGSAMKDFSNAAFSPDTIKAMTAAFESSVSVLPEPVSSSRINLVAESILRTAKTGERDPSILQRIALMELQLSPSD